MIDYITEPDDITFEAQGSGETIELLLRKHFITNVGWLLLTVVLVLIPPILTSGLIDLGSLLAISYQELVVLVVVWYLFVFGYAFEKFLIWYFNIYIVTNHRIVDIDFFQLLYKRVSAADLNEIQDITFSMGGIFQATFNYGDVRIQTAAETEQFEFESVPRPATVQKTILELAKLKKA